MRSAALILMLGACNAPLDQRLAIVRAPRVLAILSEPAETKPGKMAMYRALVVAPDGPIDAPPSWALCNAPKPPTEDNAVAEGCLDGEALLDLGSAAIATATVPMNACIQFGPDVPAGGFRPRDPDSTGGYYQPVRAETGVTDLAFGFTRITCNLPTAPGPVQQQYRAEYVANRNPVAVDLGISVQADQVRADRDLTVTASWTPDSAESYLYFDPRSQTLVTRREAMRVSWFASSGAMSVDASEVGEDGRASTLATTWHTLDTGPAWLWVVLRDSRGGTAVATTSVTVIP